MPISFSQIPANIKVPLYWAEVDPSMAGLPSINLRALMVGTMTGDGTATPEEPIPIGSQAMADAFFGPGSELGRMFQSYYSNNFANEVWGLPLFEPAGASAATGVITISSPPTEAGTLHFYIAGTYVPVNVGPSDTIEDIAQAIEDAINNYYSTLNPYGGGNPALPVTASQPATPDGTVELTCVWKGVNGNDIFIMLNYYGTRGSQQTPVGLGIQLPEGSQSVNHAAVAVGGTGHHVGDIIQLGNGVSVKVNTITAGAVVTASVATPGSIPAGSSPPTNPVSQVTTSGTGTGATFALTWVHVAEGFLSGGAGTPNFANGIANIQRHDFEYVALPVHRQPVVVRLGSRIRLHGHRPLGMGTRPIWPRFLRQARDVSRPGVVRRDAQQRRRIHHGVRADDTDADVGVLRRLCCEGTARFHQ